MTMRKLKLQVQKTVDGFVAGPEGQLDWMTRDLDEGVIGRGMRIFNDRKALRPIGSTAYPSGVVYQPVTSPQR